MPAMTASPAPIVHVVCFKLKNAADAAQVQERFAALQQTSLLPDGKQAIVSLKGGTNTSKEGGTKGMTVGYVLEFATQEHLDFYLDDCQAHGSFKQFIGPLIDDAFVFDFTNGSVAA